MCKSKYKILLFVLCALAATAVSAQKAERTNIRRGNRLFNKGNYVQAEVDYRKALEVNPKSTVSMYNLGNALTKQNKPDKAIEQYVQAANIEKNKGRLAQIYHNMGVIFQGQKQYDKAVEAYKRSLRNNPYDDQTRYNLVLAQKMLKNQQKQNKNQNKNKDKNKENKDKQKQDQQKQQKQDQQKQQQKQQKQKNQMSKENAEQMLNSALQDEKNVQQNLKKMQRGTRGKLDKNW